MEIGTKFRILSIDEEKEVQYYLKRMFIQKGYKFFAAQSGKDGITQITNGCPDLVLLDLILPDMDGMDIIKKVRSVSDCPMIVVSSKPFGSEELMARIRCALRYRRKYGSKNVYEYDGLKVDYERRLVVVDGKQIHLTPVEYRIMEYLTMNSGKVVTYQMLLEKIWGPYVSENNKILRVNMTNIRRKIGDDPAEPKYIFTESGVGYRMAESED